MRPNSGRIQPSGSVEVQVLLQAMKEDPPLDARCRDKFLVQSVAVPADQLTESSNVAQIWAGIETTAKSSIQEKKIRVTFLPSDGVEAQTNGLAAPGAAPGSSHGGSDDAAPPAYSNSPSSPSTSIAAVTPQRSSTRGGVDGPVSTFDDKPHDAKTRAEALYDAHSATAANHGLTQPANSSSHRQ